MAARRTAAPPIATPAMPPVLSFPELGAAAAAAVGDVVLSIPLAVEMAIDVTVVGLLLAIPLAVRFVYAAQSLTGTASGHVGF